MLLGEVVAGASGYLLPLRPWRSLDAGPGGFPSFARAHGRDSAGDPLMEFSSSSRFSRHPCPCPLGRERLSWGFGPFSACKRSGPRPRSCDLGSTGVPRRRLRCRSQVFSTSQRLLPSSAVPPFSDGWRSWGLPFRGLFHPRRPDDSSPSASPLDVPFPRVARPLVLGEGIAGEPGVA